MKTFTRVFIRTLICAYYIIGIACFLWLFASWADVAMHNHSTNIYQPWNCFTMIVEAKQQMGL